MFPSVFQEGSELYIKMGTLHGYQVSSASGYDTRKCRRRDKILCKTPSQVMDPYDNIGNILIINNAFIANILVLNNEDLFFAIF